MSNYSQDLSDGDIQRLCFNSLRIRTSQQTQVISGTFNQFWVPVLRGGIIMLTSKHSIDLGTHPQLPDSLLRECV